MQNENYFYNPTYLSAFKGLISRKAKQKKISINQSCDALFLMQTLSERG